MWMQLVPDILGKIEFSFELENIGKNTQFKMQLRGYCTSYPKKLQN